VGGNEGSGVSLRAAGMNVGQRVGDRDGPYNLQVGFQQLGLQDVVCFTLTTNSASRRVMERSDSRRDLVTRIPHALPHYRFSK